MVTTVCKRYKFSAAHYLEGHDSLCKSYHGHTFWADVYARGPVQESGPEKNMVVGYSRLSAAWKKLEPSLDHTLLNDMIDYPTTEVVAKAILSHMQAQVREVFKIKLWEGPGQFVEVEVERDGGGSERPGSWALSEPQWMPVGVAQENIPAGAKVFVKSASCEVIGDEEFDLTEAMRVHLEGMASTENPHYKVGDSPWKKREDEGGDA